MKVVKLNKTHNLFKYGYTHGIRFPSRTSEVNKFIYTISLRFGQTGDKWTYYRSRRNRPFWVGFKDEKVLTFVLMLDF